ncbi:uncharacterized protein [Panulirus ornatus]|uniref:uncharacterized protein isoform X2 n=1 Tax=Panulirus ornatus TaxID=150431 RepID=UPI003A8918AF
MILCGWIYFWFLLHLDLMTKSKLKVNDQEDVDSDANKIPVSPDTADKEFADKLNEIDVGMKGKPLKDAASDSGAVVHDSSATGKVSSSSSADIMTTRDPPGNKVRISPGRKDIQQQLKEESEAVTRQELVTFFSHSSKGSGTMIAGCSISQFSVRSRCSANVLELTASARSPVLGQLLLVEGDGQVLMDGAYQVVYAVLGPPSPTTGRHWRLTRELLKSDINFDCTNCDSLKVRVLLKAGDSTCGIEVLCQQRGGLRLGNTGNRVMEKVHGSPATLPTPSATSRPVSPPQDPTSTAKTTIALVYGWGMNGADVAGLVGLGTVMSLVVSVYCEDVTLDLHMVKCDAKGEDGRTVQLVKDGCSVSQVMGEFREVLGVVYDKSFGAQPVRKVTQYARLEAFNTRNNHQMITVLCTIKICSGECVERPTCVHSDINLGRSKRPTLSLYSQEVTLGKAFSVAGLPVSPSEELSSKILQSDRYLAAGTTDGVPSWNRSCVSYRTLYILLGFLTGVYLAILVLCIYCVRRSTTRTVVKSCMEDYESPARALYPEYNSPRKRTPKSSPEYSTFAISADECNNSPDYRRKL